MVYTGRYSEDLRFTLRGFEFDELKNQKILITGATGLIGSAIIDILFFLNEQEAANIQIYAAVRNIEKARQRFKPYIDKTYFNIIYYTATEYFQNIIYVDYIIHAASNSHPSVIGKEPVETMVSNFYGLLLLLNYAKEYGVKRIVYVSSGEIYGKKEDDTPYGEENYGYIDILNPRASYPVSKRAAETLSISYSKEYGVDSVIVRPSHIYGPTQTEDDSRASAQFLRSASKAEDIIMKSTGIQRRSYCHCLDCATAILTVLLKGERGQAYNIANPLSIITIKEFAEVCADVANRKVCFNVPTESETATYNMMDNSVLLSYKLEILGWKGVWEARDGIKESIEVLRENMNYAKDGLVVKSHDSAIGIDD